MFLLSDCRAITCSDFCSLIVTNSPSQFQYCNALNHNQLTAEEKEAVSTHEYQPIPLEPR